MKKANFDYPYNGLERLSGMGQEFKNNMYPLFRIFYKFYNNNKENLWRCESIKMLSASSYEMDGILLCFRVFFSCIYFLRGICIPLFLFWFELLLLLLASCASDS